MTSVRSWPSLSTTRSTVALLGAAIVLLVTAAVLVVPARLPAQRLEARAPARPDHLRGIPAGLAEAIHARLGPGPIGLGAAPLVSGFEPAGGGWRAKAAAQSLQARITPRGAVISHVAGSAGVALRPVALSAGPRRAALSARPASPTSGRLVQRLGAVTSSYAVTAAGLEQSFTIARPPSRASQLALQFSSPVRWRSLRAGSAITPSGAHGGELAYAGLRASDARGRRLRSRFQISAGGPQIVVDTRGAVYPVRIDPTWTTTPIPTATLTNSPTDQQGVAVALSQDGTTALVGSERAAYIFHASAEGSWSSSSSPSAKLSDPSMASVSGYPLTGSFVSLSSDGTTALIGADGVNGYRGAAYIFHTSSEGSWSSSSIPTATLTDGSGARDFFGLSATLSADGTTALIGTPYQQGNLGAGAAYVFHASSEGSWSSSSSPTATLTNSAGASHDWLGYSVALSSDGTTALAGAPGLNSGQGAAYIFHASSEGSWSTSSTPTATLSNGSGASEDSLGVAVALSSDGTTALLGAPVVSGRKGAAYIFHASAEGSWSTSSTPSATLSNGSGASEDSLGVAVALSSDGTTALLGAPGVNGGRGAAYVFHTSAEGSWSSSSAPSATVSNGSAHSGDALGVAVSLSSDGTTALLGTPGVSGFEGAANVFHASAEASWSSSSAPSATLSGPSGPTYQAFGTAVALSGDGTTALVSEGGVAYIFHASSEGSWSSSSAPAATLSDPSMASDSGNPLSGSFVALSTDGTTALIGAAGAAGKGVAYIFHASSEASWASSSAPAATLSNGSGAAGEELGYAVALSSDGTTALLGAPGAAGKGAAYVFHASSEGSWASSSAPSATLSNGSGASGDKLGYAVALSSDGTTALLGAPFVDSEKGAAYIFHTSTEGSWASSTTPTATLSNGSGGSGDALGVAVALSSDGTTALLSAPNVNGNDGAAYVFHAAGEGSWSSSSVPAATLTNSAVSSRVGSSVALSADGTTAMLGDISAGGPWVFNIYVDSWGAVYVFQASSESSWASSSTPSATLSNDSGSPLDGLGNSLALSSDGMTALVGDQGFDLGGAAMVFSLATGGSPASPYLSLSVPSAAATGGPIAPPSVTGALSSGSAPGGSISFKVFGPQAVAPSSCASGGTPVGSSVPVSGNDTYNPSSDFTPPSAGDYWWYATYSGDSANNPAASLCGPSMPETVVTASGLANPSLSLSAPSAGSAGEPISAASVSGTLAGGSAPSGSVSFKVFGPQASAPSICTAGGSAVGSGVSVSGNGTYNPSSEFTPSGAGDYWWYATYGGDSANNPAASPCGPSMAETVITGSSGSGGGGGGGGSPAPQTPSSAPSCTIAAKGGKVMLAPSKKKGAKQRRKPKGKPGTLQFLLSCDQAAEVTLSGKLTAVLKKKHAKKHGKTKVFKVAAVRASLTADNAQTLTVKLPKAALAALARRSREAALFTLTASNANGTGEATARIPRLKALRI